MSAMGAIAALQPAGCPAGSPPSVFEAAPGFLAAGSLLQTFQGWEHDLAALAGLPAEAAWAAAACPAGKRPFGDSNAPPGAAPSSSPAFKRLRIELPSSPGAELTPIKAQPGLAADGGDDAAAAALAASVLSPLPLDPASLAALGLSPGAMAQFELLSPLGGGDGLAAAPLQMLPLAGPGQQAALDPLLHLPCIGLDGQVLSSEQIAAGSLFSGANSLSFLLAPGQAGGPAAHGMQGGAAPAPAGPWPELAWQPQEEQDLLALVDDPSARQQKLGCAQLDWGLLQAHFPGRSLSAIRKKYWQLAEREESTVGLQLRAADPSQRCRRADRKLWSDSEARELLRLGTEPWHRAAVLRLDASSTETDMWEALGMHFACTIQMAKRKFRQCRDAHANGTLRQEKAKRTHHAKKTPYRWMIVSALSQLPGRQGTPPDIFQRILATPAFAPDLDHRIMPGTKHVPRWKIQVRKALSQDAIFQHTGLKERHETVWRLNQARVRAVLQKALAASRAAGRNTAAAAAIAALMERLPNELCQPPPQQPPPQRPLQPQMQQPQMQQPQMQQPQMQQPLQQQLHQPCQLQQQTGMSTAIPLNLQPPQLPLPLPPPPLASFSQHPAEQQWLPRLPGVGCAFAPAPACLPPPAMPALHPSTLAALAARLLPGLPLAPKRGSA